MFRAFNLLLDRIRSVFAVRFLGLAPTRLLGVTVTRAYGH